MGTALLINPSYRRTYGSNEGGLAFPVFPVLSLASMAGAAVARGHNVEILDLSYRHYRPDDVIDAVRSLRPTHVGITATTPLVNQLRDISFLLHDLDPELVVVGGGAHVSALPELTLRQSDLDIVVQGEADHLLAELLDGTSVNECAGTWWREGDHFDSRPPALIENLDLLPWPAWDRYPTECQASISDLVARHRPIATVEFSRGCIYRCDFCGSKNTMGHGYRKKSPERCAEELARLAAAGYREALLVDDIFTSDTEWAAEVCEAIIRRRTGIAWTCSNGIRVDATSAELFELLARAGCYRVHFGFESGDDTVLRAFGKGGRASLDQGRSAVAHARSAGLEVNGYFMVGLSGDSVQSMRETIDFARSLPVDASKCGMTVPFPGTKMFHDLHEANRIKTYDWDQYTVYNEAESIFDHPTLSWSDIRRAFRRFYLHVYLLNPRYVARRTVSSLRRRQFLTHFGVLRRYLQLTLIGSRDDPAESYRFESRWRSFDRLAQESIPAPDSLRARTRSGPTNRDGLVTSAVATPARRRHPKTAERSRTQHSGHEDDRVIVSGHPHTDEGERGQRDDQPPPGQTAPG